MLKQPLLIAFEGPDGVGKTTSVDYVSKILRGQGHTVKVVRAMGSGEVGHIVREFLLKQYFTSDQGALACALAIMDAYRTALTYLEQGHSVILDRYIGTYYAYNIKGNQERLAPDLFELLFTDDSIITHKPDIIFYLTVGNDTTKQRMLNRQQESTHFDKADQAYRQRLLEGYTDFSIRYTGAEWVVIDNNHDITYLQQQLDEELSNLLQTQEKLCSNT